MTPFQKSSSVAAILLVGAGLCLPPASYAAPTCNNGFLTGTYNAEISSLSFMSVLSAINASAAGGTGAGGSANGGATGSAGTTAVGGIGNGVSSAGGATGNPNGIGGSQGGTTGGTSGSGGGYDAANGGAADAIANPGGFANNRFSLSGAIQGAGRYYLDGNGNIWGRDPSAPNTTMIVGSYSVANDCSATMSLNTGEHFNAEVVDSGGEVLFLQSDAGAGGAIGTLTRAVESCPGPSAFPQNFGFNIFGAQPASVSAMTGSIATVVSSFAPYSAVGDMQLTDDGTFTMREWIYSNGRVQSARASGTYTVTADCRLQLNFATQAVNGGTTGSVSFQAPVTFVGALNRGVGSGRNTGAGSGLLIIQPQNVTTVVGSFLAR